MVNALSLVNTYCISFLSLMKNKGDLERERDELKAEIDNNNNKVQVLERTIEHLKKTIDEKVIKNSTLLLPD